MAYATRIKVEGKYNSKGEYVLTDLSNGQVYMTIREGESFRIANQMREWDVERHGKMLYAVKGSEIVKLPNKKIGLWAVTSGAARNGLFHWYKQPQNKIEAACEEAHVSSKVIEFVDEIDESIVQGGCYCNHTINAWGTILEHDGQEDDLEEVPLVREHSNQYHIGCVDGLWKVRVHNANYILVWNLSTSMNGSRWYHLERAVIKKNITAEKEEEICRKIKEIKEH